MSREGLTHVRAGVEHWISRGERGHEVIFVLILDDGERLTALCKRHLTRDRAESKIERFEAAWRASVCYLCGATLTLEERGCWAVECEACAKSSAGNQTI